MQSDAGVITALAPWFGGKRTLAPEIAEALGPHSVYWEPFCGSMAVLLGKPPCKTEIVNDLHGDLVNLARVIVHPREGPRLYRRLRRTWASQDLMVESLQSIRASDPPDGIDPGRAYHFFLASWQGVNGVAGTRSCNTRFARRFTATGGDAGARWVGAVRSIPAWRRRMGRVQILRSDGIELCERIEDAADTAIYCDPPLSGEGSPIPPRLRVIRSRPARGRAPALRTGASHRQLLRRRAARGPLSRLV